MTRIKDIIQHLETIAPPAYQESYDNSTLIVGDRDKKVNSALLTLDVTEEVIDEAIANNHQLIIAHHPIVFRGLKSLTGKNYVERVVIKAIKNDVAIYAIHTNLDNILGGVNKKIAEKIGLEDLKVLAPKSETLLKLTVFVPESHDQELKDALFTAGAGNIGNYSSCSFTSKGQGQFLPSEKANPAIGKKSQLEKVSENRIEVILPVALKGQVLNAMHNAHPYEEVAYYLQTLENKNQDVGSGMIGKLPNAVDAKTFLKDLKKKMNVNIIRHTAICRDKVQKIAICGGAGSFLISTARAKKADVYITADIKYHEFFDAENELILADIGHYESEQFTKELIHELLNEKFPNFALNFSTIVTNPISYI